MVDHMSPEALQNLLAGNTQFAFIDVREAGEYNTSHIPGSSLISRRHLELQLPLTVPYKGTPVILCDDDGRRVSLAAVTVERMLGFYHLSSFRCSDLGCWVYYENTLPSPPRSEH